MGTLLNQIAVERGSFELRASQTPAAQILPSQKTEHILPSFVLTQQAAAVLATNSTAMPPRHTIAVIDYFQRSNS